VELETLRFLLCILTPNPVSLLLKMLRLRRRKSVLRHKGDVLRPRVRAACARRAHCRQRFVQVEEAVPARRCAHPAPPLVPRMTGPARQSGRTAGPAAPQARVRRRALCASNASEPRRTAHPRPGSEPTTAPRSLDPRSPPGGGTCGHVPPIGTGGTHKPLRTAGTANLATHARGSTCGPAGPRYC